MFSELLQSNFTTALNVKNDEAQKQKQYFSHKAVNTFISAVVWELAHLKWPFEELQVFATSV